MNYLKKIFLYLFVIVIGLFSSATSSVIASPIHEATLNVTDYDPFSNEFYMSLDGEWLFFEKELIDPKEVSKKVKANEGEIVTIPNSFEKHTGDVNTYGTYSKSIRLPNEMIGSTLAISIPYQYSAYKLFVNEQLLISNGVVGSDPLSHETEMAPEHGYFIVDSDELLITMQISSFNHIRGGFENSIYIGEAPSITKKFNGNMIATLFVNGGIFIIGIFMALFSLYSRQRIEFFIFGLFAILISVRALFAHPFYYTLIFDLSWLWGTRLEYVLTVASSLLYVLFFWKWHEKEFSKIALYFLIFVHTGTMIATFFTEPVFFQKLFFNVFTLAIPYFIYMVYIIIKSYRNYDYNLKANLIGIFIIFIAFFNDFAIGQSLYQSVTLMLPAVGIYVSIQVLLMSKNFADNAKKTEEQFKQLQTVNAYNEKLTIELQEEIKRKDDFLANTSHELRNPLHGIINITQSILNKQERQLDKETKSDIELQLTISRHMSRTLEDLLDFTRLKEHRITLYKEKMSIQPVVLVVIDMLKLLIENKNIKIENKIKSDFPFVAADRNRIIQILFNLIHNAVKFTEVGTITIDGEVRNEMAFIRIIDTGIGMSEETLSTIFEPYKQVDSSIVSIGGGLGLGLSISKQLIEMHGGTINVKSKINEGSEFIFTLPLADVNEIAESSNERAPLSNEKLEEISIDNLSLDMNHTILEAYTKHTNNLKRSRILAVDDDPVNLQLLKKILPDNNFEIEVVTNAMDALEKVHTEEWDLIISDVMMPKMSGYDLTKKIREKYSRLELPILLLTARNNSEDIYSGFLAGANDYITKPVDALELIVRVHVLTDLRASIIERLNMEAAYLQAQIRPHFLMNTLNAIMTLSEYDIERMKRLLEQFSEYLQRSFYLKNLDQLVPLQFEIELLESYLYIEKVRFEDRLQFKWEVDESIDKEKIMIPPLSLQTLVENAVNHGVLQRIKGGLIEIKIRNKDPYIQFIISDNGIGMSEEQLHNVLDLTTRENRGIGLLNTEQRLRQLYGEGLQIDSEQHVGTTISFKIPLKQDQKMNKIPMITSS